MPVYDCDQDESDANSCGVMSWMKLLILLCIFISVMCVPLLPSKQKEKGDEHKVRKVICVDCDFCGTIHEFAQNALAFLEALFTKIVESINHLVKMIITIENSGKCKHDKTNRKMDMIGINKEEKDKVKLGINKEENYKVKQKIKKEENRCVQQSPYKDEKPSVSTNESSDVESNLQPHCKTPDSSTSTECEKCERNVKECLSDCPYKIKNGSSECQTKLIAL